MTDIHQPDDEDRHRAERDGDDRAGVPEGEPEVEELRDERPSSRRDPNAPDRPQT